MVVVVRFVGDGDESWERPREVARKAAHHPSGRKTLRGVGDAAVLNLGEPPPEVVIRGRPEVRDLDPGAGDRTALQIDDPTLDARAGRGRCRSLRCRIEGRICAVMVAVTVATGGLDTGLGSSDPRAPNETNPAATRVVAARIPIEAIFSLVKSTLLMMMVVKAAAVAELAPPVAAVAVAQSQRRGDRRASPGHRAAQHNADRPGGDPSPNQTIPQP